MAARPERLDVRVRDSRRESPTALARRGARLATGVEVAQHVLAEHVVGGADVHAVAGLLVRGGVGLVAEVEPLGQALEAGDLARRQAAARSPRMLVWVIATSAGT